MIDKPQQEVTAVASTVIVPGVKKFPHAQVLSTSSGRHWKRLSAERRVHIAGEIPDISPDFTEITYTIDGNSNALVNRRMVDVAQSTRATTGTIWLCPAGVPEDKISITDVLPDVLHVYLHRPLFEELSTEDGCPDVHPQQVAITAGVKDDLLKAMLITVAQELSCATDHGKLLVDTVALTICARLIQAHRVAPSTATLFARKVRRLDQVRLKRVIDYIESYLDAHIELADLAGVACLSHFHFVRSFKVATGKTPHAYVTSRRLARAKLFLQSTSLPIELISFRCGFSSQAAFTRAFTRVVGIGPAAYRRQVTS